MISYKICSDSLLNKVIEISFDKPHLSNQDIIGLCKKDISFSPSIKCYKINNSGSLLIATDHVRSIPIFYLINKDVLLISDLVNDIFSYSNQIIDAQASEEFLLTGFTTGNTTLIADIKQLQAGEYLYLSENGIQTGFYTRFLTDKQQDLPYQSLEKNLEQIFENVFTSLAERLSGRTAIIPLSGGYDSRLIAYWLHKLKYPHILCITYGRTNNCEVQSASKTANKLSLPWYFIDYTTLPIKNYLSSPVFQDYFQYLANYSSMFFMQDFFAVQYLKEKDLIPTNAVFLPGHTGDVLAGSHLNNRLDRNLSTEQLAEEIFHFHYCLTEPGEQRKAKIIKSVKNNLAVGYPHSLIFEDWDIQERQAKFIVNSARVFPFFGYDYDLPLWDIRLVDFFKTLPFELKLYKKLYKNTLEKRFKKAGLLFPDEIQASPFDYKLRDIKQSITKYLPFLKKMKQLPENDAICYKEITDTMIEDLKKNNVPTQKVYSYNGYIVQWYLAKIMGKV